LTFSHLSIFIFCSGEKTSMIDAPRPKKIRLAEAAAACGASYKTIRNWISRYEGRGVRPQARQSGGWLEFSHGDVAALALCKCLVDFGESAPQAFASAMRVVETRWPGLFDVEDPRWFLNPSLARFDILYAPGKTVSLSSALNSLEFANRVLGDPKDIVGGPHRIRVTFELAFIIRDAFEALAQMGHRVPRLLNTPERPSDPAIKPPRRARRRGGRSPRSASNKRKKQ
jgi:hypothetical protein